MTSTRYCYHCGAHHPESEMRQVDTKGGKRWRCVKSIEAAKQDASAREAFGRKVSEINKAEAQARNKARLSSDR